MPPRPKESPDVKLSKALSFILRHGAAKEKVPIRPDGFVLVADLLKNNRIKAYTLQDIARVVRDNEKQRFAMIRKEVLESTSPSDLSSTPTTNPSVSDILSSTPNDWYIRANQGHSLSAVVVDMKPLKTISDFPVFDASSSVPVAVHGTNPRAWQLIQTSGGLSRMNRTHIHLASGLFGDSNVISGMRKSADVYVYIDIEKALAAGIPFQLSANGVILSEGNQDGIIPKELFLAVKKRDPESNQLVDVMNV